MLGISETVREFLIAEDDIALTRYPAVFILAQSSRELAHFQQHDEVHSLFVIALAKHVDQQVLARQMFRYMWALRRTLKSNLPKAPAEYVMTLNVLRHDYSPVQQLENEPGFTKSVQLQIECAERLMEV